MHELSIAAAILEAVAKETARYPNHYATKVCLTLGKYAGVDPESLAFCFQSLSPLELAIEQNDTDDLDLKNLELEELAA